MYIIMLGAPGTGKGTIGSAIGDIYGIPHISSGDMIREEIKNKTELGMNIEKYVLAGDLVPYDLLQKTIESMLNSKKCENGAVLDGIPRTVEQAEDLDRILSNQNKKVDIVLELKVPDEDIIKRTSSRVICTNKECGASFNTIFMPPKKEGICDYCGSELIKRKDDNPETIKDRLEVYYKNTKPLIDFYTNKGVLSSIDIDIYKENTKDITMSKAQEYIKNLK